MNITEAKQILLLYRPGVDDPGQDPELAQALELAQADPELGGWFEAHCGFQQVIRTRLREVSVPQDLKAALLAHTRVVRPRAWWRAPAWYAAAAALVVLAALSALWLQPRVPNSFADFRGRMVSTVLREYRMDLVTHDMRQVRRFLSQGGAPADYTVPAGLRNLRLTGSGLLRWRSHPVAMVCFERGDKQMLFLFVLRRSAVKDPPKTRPSTAPVRGLATVSWTAGENTYVLAGPPEAGFEQKYTGG